jgi:hypothetical protein
VLQRGTGFRRQSRRRRSWSRGAAAGGGPALRVLGPPRGPCERAGGRPCAAPAGGGSPEGSAGAHPSEPARRSDRARARQIGIPGGSRLQRRLHPASRGGGPIQPPEAAPASRGGGSIPPPDGPSTGRPSRPLNPGRVRQLEARAAHRDSDARRRWPVRGIRPGPGRPAMARPRGQSGIDLPRQRLPVCDTIGDSAADIGDSAANQGLIARLRYDW